MARPPKLNAEWFTHSASLRNDRRVKAIRTATGAAGYGIFHMLLEALTDADYTTLPVDEIELELLAGDFGVSVTEIDSLLQIGKKVGYFSVDDANMLTCPELNRWLEMHFEKRNRSRNRGSGDSPSQPDAEMGVSVTEIPHNTLYNTTEHNSIEEENTTSSLRSEVVAPPKVEKVEPVEVQPEELPTVEAQRPASHTRGARRTMAFEPPTYEQMLNYMQQQRPNLAMAEVEKVATKCFGYYTANGWKVGKNPMKKWEGGCQTFLSDIPKNSTVIPQRNAVHQRSTSSYGANSAASRLQTSTPDATAANPWGYPGG